MFDKINKTYLLAFALATLAFAICGVFVANCYFGFLASTTLINTSILLILSSVAIITCFLGVGVYLIKGVNNVNNNLNVICRLINTVNKVRQSLTEIEVGSNIPQVINCLAIQSKGTFNKIFLYFRKHLSKGDKSVNSLSEAADTDIKKSFVLGAVYCIGYVTVQVLSSISFLLMKSIVNIAYYIGYSVVQVLSIVFSLVKKQILSNDPSKITQTSPNIHPSVQRVNEHAILEIDDKSQFIQNSHFSINPLILNETYNKLQPAKKIYSTSKHDKVVKSYDIDFAHLFTNKTNNDVNASHTTKQKDNKDINSTSMLESYSWKKKVFLGLVTQSAPYYNYYINGRLHNNSISEINEGLQSRRMHNLSKNVTNAPPLLKINNGLFNPLLLNEIYNKLQSAKRIYSTPKYDKVVENYETSTNNQSHYYENLVASTMNTITSYATSSINSLFYHWYNYSNCFTSVVNIVKNRIEMANVKERNDIYILVIQCFQDIISNFRSYHFYDNSIKESEKQDKMNDIPNTLNVYNTKEQNNINDLVGEPPLTKRKQHNNQNERCKPRSVFDGLMSVTSLNSSFIEDILNR